MKNYVTSAVLEEAPCVNSCNDYNVILKKECIVLLKTDKGIFYAGYDRIPTSLIRELASMKAGDKIDIFFRIKTFDEFLKEEPMKFFYDVKIHEGDIMRFKQCLWHEEIPVIARIDMFKVKCGLPGEKRVQLPRLDNFDMIVAYSDTANHQ